MCHISEEQDSERLMCLPEDVEHCAGCQASKNCSPKPQDLKEDKVHGDQHLTTGTVMAEFH